MNETDTELTVDEASSPNRAATAVVLGLAAVGAFRVGRFAASKLRGIRITRQPKFRVVENTTITEK